MLDKPMAIATQVLDYDIDWPDWVPKVRAGSKTLTCECVVLPLAAPAIWFSSTRVTLAWDTRFTRYPFQSMRARRLPR